MSRTGSKKAKLSLQKKQIRTLSGAALDEVQGGAHAGACGGPDDLDSKHAGAGGKDTIVGNIGVDG